ncbi:MAG: hypothetical protein ACYSU1_01370 [Planctomycetota bacterium]
MSKPPLTQPREFLSHRLEEEWERTFQAYQAFLEVPARRRFEHLGTLFEQLCPWIERAIRSVTIRHFILLPTEMAVARLFAKSCRRENLPQSHVIFQIWLESSILRDVADPQDELGATNGAAGEPNALLQRRFNRLPYADRALLYLYMVERCSVREVSGYTGIPQAYAVENLGRIWAQVHEGVSEEELPRGWQAPRLNEHGCVCEEGNTSD